MKEQIELNPWTTLSRSQIYETPWFRVVECKCLNPKQKPANYGVVEFKNLAIGVLALDSLKNIYLVGQWRFPLEKYSWEIPEGGCLIGRDPLEEAKRELKEETGLVATQWKKYFEMHLSNSVTDELAIVYLAEGLSQNIATPEETEVLQIKKLHLNKAYQMIVKGEITDAISVAAIQRLYIEQKEVY